MGLPYAYSDPTISGGADGANLYAWIVNNMLFEGTMRGLFTLLFGAGAILLTTRLEKIGAGIQTADIYYRRILWLLIFGLINVWVLLWHGDILYPYAIFGLTLFPFRNTSVKKLLLLGGILIAIGVLWNIIDYRSDLAVQQTGIEAQNIKDSHATLTIEQEDAIKNWDKLQSKKTPEEITKLIHNMHQGYWKVITKKIKLNQFMQTWLPYRLWVWDILSFMLIGMAFFKLRIFHGERSYKFYTLMLIVGYSIGLSINYLETKIILDGNFSNIEMHRADMTYQIGRLFTTIGHIGLFMLFIKSGVLRVLQKALAAVGRMALTNYLMHSIITSILFYGFGFSLFGQLERFELYYIVGAIWVFQLIFSPIWLKYFQYGPAEWLWRSLSYRKRQPFLIEK
jgi:uncharacterized protein